MLGVWAEFGRKSIFKNQGGREKDYGMEDSILSSTGNGASKYSSMRHQGR